MVAASKLFGKYLLLTNTVSCGVMMGGGDWIQQRLEHWKTNNARVLGNSSIVLAASQEDEPPVEKYKPYLHDYTRMSHMVVVGLLQGPFHHWFYTFLERYFPGRGAKAIIKKTCMDQSIASPTCLGIFFIGIAVMENRSLKEIKEELKLKFVDTWKVDCCFWPPIQFINFMFVPLHYRVLYTNFMTMVYDIFLSYMKYDAHYD